MVEVSPARSRLSPEVGPKLKPFSLALVTGKLGTPPVNSMLLVQKSGVTVNGGEKA